MANTPYCTRRDLHDYGLPRGTLPNVGRLAAAVGVATNTFELDGHGCDTGSPLTLRPEAGGALPVPLVAGTQYFAIRIDDDHFQVAATATGPAIDLTTTGARVVVVTPLPIDAACLWASRILDDLLPSAVVPLVAPFPPVVVMTAAELAIWKLGTFTGATSGSITTMTDFAQKRLARWSSGISIRGDNAPEPTQLAQSSATYAGRTDTRGWFRYGGIR